ALANSSPFTRCCRSSLARSSSSCAPAGTPALCASMIDAIYGSSPEADKRPLLRHPPFYRAMISRRHSLRGRRVPRTNQDLLDDAPYDYRPSGDYNITSGFPENLASCGHALDRAATGARVRESRMFSPFRRESVHARTVSVPGHPQVASPVSRPAAALLVADAERREGLHHAGGDGPAVRAAPC